MGLAGLGAALAVGLLAGCSTGIENGALPSTPEITNQTGTIIHLWNGSWIAALTVGVITWGLMLWCVAVYRKRKGDNKLPPQNRAHVPLELMYTAVPIVMIAVLLRFTASDIAEIRDVSQKPDYTIEAIGTVVGDPNRARTLSLAHGGQAVSVVASAGQRVQRGETLLTISPDPTARQAFQQAQAALSLARGDLQRTEKLAAQRLATQSQLAAARKVTRVDPNNSAAMVLAALVQQKQNKWSDAQTTLLAAQKLAPANTTVLCMLGIAAQHLDHPDAAAGYYQQALNANPDDTWAQELLNSLTPTKVSLVP